MYFYGVFYKITNKINNKIYIGQTITPLQKRWLKHCSEANFNSDKMAIAKAIAKYKKENFIIEEIDCAASRKELNDKEKYWIEHYQSYKSEKGYNLTLGGDAVNLSPEREQERISKLIKKVYQYSLEGEFVKEWNSAAEASRFYQDTSSTISKCARQHQYCKTAKGFQWSYTFIDKMPNLKNIGRIGKKNHQPKIAMYKDNRLIKVFDSINESAEFILQSNLAKTKNINSIVDAIYRFLYKKKKVTHAYGFIWAYYN